MTRRRRVDLDRALDAALVERRADRPSASSLSSIAAVALEQRLEVAMAGQAAVDALDADAAAACSRTPATGSAAPEPWRADDRHRARAEQVAGRLGELGRRVAAHQPQRERVEPLAREGRDVRAHALAQQRVAAAGRAPARRPGSRRPPASAPSEPIACPLGVAHVSPQSRPSPTACSIAAPASASARIAASQHPRGAQRLEVVEEDRPVRRPGTAAAARERAGPAAVVRFRARRGSGPSRSPYAEQRTGDPVPSALATRQTEIRPMSAARKQPGRRVVGSPCSPRKGERRDQRSRSWATATGARTSSATSWSARSSSSGGCAR